MNSFHWTHTKSNVSFLNTFLQPVSYNSFIHTQFYIIFFSYTFWRVMRVQARDGEGAVYWLMVFFQHWVGITSTKTSNLRMYEIFIHMNKFYMFYLKCKFS